MEKRDLESGKEGVEPVEPHQDIDNGEVAEVKRAHDIQNRIAVFRVLRQGEEWMDRKMGIETRGIDRIPEEKKQPPSTWNIFFMWWSLNIHVGVLPLGVLGPEFGLSLRNSIAAAIGGTVLGALTTAYTGTLGPKVSCTGHGRRNGSTTATSVLTTLLYDSWACDRLPLRASHLVFGVQSSAVFSTSLLEAVLPW